MRAAHVFIIILVLGAEVVFGQSPDSVYTIGEITVTATRDRTTPSRAPQRVSILTTAAAQSSGAQNLADLLEARSGFFVRRYGGGLATVTMRGASPSQTALLVDGLRLSDPQLGQFDMSLLPALLIESVEIVHGPTSSLYGADGMAGAINLRSRRPRTDSITLFTEAGAFGNRRVSAGAALVASRIRGTVAAEYSYADGDFPYLNETLFPAREVRRRNADREKRSLFGSMEYGAGPHRLQAAVLFADARRGLPGGAGSPPIGERQWDGHARLWLLDYVRLEHGSVKWSAFFHRGALRYVNPQIALDETGRTISGGTEAVLRRPLGSGTVLVAGASGGYAAADHPSLSESAREVHGAVFVSATHEIGTALLYPAIRGDVYTPSSGVTRAAVSPRIGVNLPVARSLFAKANVGTAFRMPTFNDRFWQPGGNPHLQPERSRSIEIGLYLDLPRLAFELTAFRSRTENQIVWDHWAGGIWSPDNLSESEAAGVEASLHRNWHDRISTGLIYSFTRAVDRSDHTAQTYGRQLRYIPAHQAKLYADAAAGPVTASIHARYVGRRFVTSDESESLDPVLTIDGQAGVAAPIGPVRARLSLIVENVLNARYALIQNYPMPPRHARVRLSLDL